jgi:hypothetical protein
MLGIYPPPQSDLTHYFECNLTYNCECCFRDCTLAIYKCTESDRIIFGQRWDHSAQLQWSTKPSQLCLKQSRKTTVFYHTPVAQNLPQEPIFCIFFCRLVLLEQTQRSKPDLITFTPLLRFHSSRLQTNRSGMLATCFFVVCLWLFKHRLLSSERSPDFHFPKKTSDSYCSPKARKKSADHSKRVSAETHSRVTRETSCPPAF